MAELCQQHVNTRFDRMEHITKLDTPYRIGRKL